MVEQLLLLLLHNNKVSMALPEKKRRETVQQCTNGYLRERERTQNQSAFLAKAFTALNMMMMIKETNRICQHSLGANVLFRYKYMACLKTVTDLARTEWMPYTLKITTKKQQTAKWVIPHPKCLQYTCAHLFGEHAKEPERFPVLHR